MKKFIFILCLMMGSSFAMAQHRYQLSGHHHNHHNHAASWIVPALVTGLIVHGITRADQRQESQVVYIPQPQPVYVQQQPRPVVIDEPLYRKIEVYDQTCACVKQVFVQITKESK